MTRKNRPNVFVVDDVPEIGTSLVSILTVAGYRATAFTSPLKALEAARYGAPHILISDVDMPDLSGIDLAILMAKHFPSVKTLLFSGHEATERWLEIARQKGHHFRLLQKPVDPSVMLNEVAKMSPGVRQLSFTRPKRAVANPADLIVIG